MRRSHAAELAELFPYQRRTVGVPGGEYAFLDEGTGPPVVMVHGNPSWSFYFRSLVAALPAAGYRALAPDHLGMGRSAKPPRREYRNTLDNRIADFTSWMDAVCPTGPVILVVHDWGGAIALAWAVARPERVRELILMNTAAFPLPAGKTVPLALRAARLPLLGDVAVRYANAFARGAATLGVRKRMPDAVRRGYLAPYDTPAHRIAVLDFVRDIPTRTTDPAHATLARTEAGLGRLADVPTIVCWGMRDFVLDQDILNRWTELLPAAEVHRFPEAGHYVLEDAAAAIVPLVLDFLAGAAPDGSVGGAAVSGAANG